MFQASGIYYRQVNRSYAADYTLFIQSGLYTSLQEYGLLIPHREIPENLTGTPDWFMTLLPEQIPLITYPYEWCPAQLKDAALLTLKIMRVSLDQGMILKDATPFNIQFQSGKPVFIDTLSFERYDASMPWVAYRQFCECFLYPLLLHHYQQAGTAWILSAYPEGIPATLTRKLLPYKSRFKLSTWLHVTLPARLGHGRAPGISQSSSRRSSPTSNHSAGFTPDGAAGQPGRGKSTPFSKARLERLIAHLESIISGLKVSTAASSEWSGYYNHSISSKAYLEGKEEYFKEIIRDIPFENALDLGANDGHFSKILAEKKIPVLSVDSDWLCIQHLYESTRDGAFSNILPLCIDIADPTPARGVANNERNSFTARAASDLVLALALIHHLVLGRNIPLPKIASFFALLTRNHLIAEFVPLSDERSQQLVSNKDRYHAPYDQEAFESHFSQYFTIERKITLPGSGRILYRMKKTPHQPCT